MCKGNKTYWICNVVTTECANLFTVSLILYFYQGLAACKKFKSSRKENRAGSLKWSEATCAATATATFYSVMDTILLSGLSSHSSRKENRA